METINSTKIENTIKALPGVIGCKVVVTDKKVNEVHIMASGEKSPKQIIRDVESAIMVNFDIKIDHKVISIAQLNESNFSSEEDTRLGIAGYTKKLNNNNTEIEVKLNREDNIYTGIVEGIMTTGNKLHFFSKATLNAIEKYLGKICNLTLNDIRMINIGRDKAVLVSITILTEHEENVFIGSALIKGEEELSAIKASLNAVNRRINVLTN